MGDGSDPTLRYGVCLAVAVLLIVARFVFVWQVQRSVEQQVRQQLRDAKAADRLPLGIDPDGPSLSDVGVPLPASEMRRMGFVHLLVTWRYVLIPLGLLASLGSVRLLKRNGP